LWAGVAPVVIGLALAGGDDALHWFRAAMTLLGAVLIQIGTNFSNDLSDFVKGADTETRQGPLRATQAGWVTPRQMGIATALAFGSAMLVSLYLVLVAGWPIAVIAIVALICGIGYTAGPYPLGYIGLGDLFVLVFFGPVAVAGTYFVQTGLLGVTPILAGLAPGLLSVAILAVNNLRDIDQDRAEGNRTLAVRFGRGFVRFEYLVCIAGAAGMPLVLVLIEGWHHASLAASVVLAASAIGPVRIVLTRHDGPALNPVLGATARLLIVFSIVFSAGWTWSP
jgi:1,4-dihydroxy-2-naphthoate octaprenyltransferase